MPTDIFRTISMNAGDAQKSYQWYRSQINALGRVDGNSLLRNKSLTNRLTIGHMYLFAYDPKHKDTLPYYDTLPLVLPFRSVPNGFLGINLHYLPYLARFRILGELSKLVTDDTVSETARIKISWQILEGSSKLLAATACVKHYLRSHLKSNFLKIDFNDWVTASMLPIERFKKESKVNVWKETQKKYGSRY